MNVFHCMVALVARSTVVSHGRRELSPEPDVYAKFGETPIPEKEDVTV